ncbi:hypothetical protein NA57DRAFT_60427 [Rhizodiscina lignyota]|uniref:Uncharacterized protein n=1 Tax=Rhizodiscina lignyota TaxID=1504668 RepID=A0A9P4I7Z1_9PEZI|nr:hypothetical protein NA57DRAFT_60427 [Rhizodiscina lignyota]
MAITRSKAKGQQAADKKKSKTNALPRASEGASQDTGQKLKLWRRNAQCNADENTDNEPRTLLTLPGEIRNFIYRAVLVKDNHITISAAYPPKEPALLRTCRTIRSEARMIWYSENDFRVIDRHQSIAPFLNFFRAHNLKEFYPKFYPTRVQGRGCIRFDDILIYIKAWYMEEILFKPSTRDCYCPDPRGYCKAVGHRLWDIAQLLKASNMSWENAKAVLDNAGELAMSEPGSDFKTEEMESCCTRMPEGWNMSQFEH